MAKNTAYPVPEAAYVLDPPIEAHGNKYAHVVVRRVDDGTGYETVLYSATHLPDPIAWVDGAVSDDTILETFGYAVHRKPTSRSGMVREFHERFGHPVADSPQLLDKERAKKRLKWIQDEVDELRDAIEADDLVEQLDALADIAYFIEGDALERGAPLEDAFCEVHASNMSKLGSDGQPIYYDDGKVAKGPNFFEPDLARVLWEAGAGD